MTDTKTAELAGYAREVLSTDLKSNSSVLALSQTAVSLGWLREKHCPFFGRLHLVHIPRQQYWLSRLSFSIEMG